MSAHHTSLLTFFPPTEAQFEVSSLSIVPGGAAMSKFQAKYSLSAGFWDHTIPSSGNSSRLSQGRSTWGLSPELQRGVPAGVHPNWVVIGLSHRLVCFPMWAIAAGRPRGTIWKQRDTLQCRTSIHYTGYREPAQGGRDTKLELRCLLALKNLPFGLPLRAREQNLEIQSNLIWPFFLLKQMFLHKKKIKS